MPVPRTGSRRRWRVAWMALAAMLLPAACRGVRRPELILGATPGPAATRTVQATEDEGQVATVASTALPTAPVPAATSTPAPTAAQRTFDPAIVSLTRTAVAEGLDEPIGIQAAGDGSGRLFILEKAGRIRVLVDGALRDTPFLDIRRRVGSNAAEQGLLGLAFHPRFGAAAGGGRFYVNYTDTAGDTVIAEYRVSADADAADPASERVLLRVGQPAANHNGGDLAFGPDGYLYAALGDGGPSADGAGSSADGHSGAADRLLGSILRLDVERGDPYGIPPDNPFVNDPAMRDEIWAFGLRNPWRISFDRATGDLYIADVGAGDWEEVDRQGADSSGGTDYGWPTMEGNHCRGGGDDCTPPPGAVPPILEYSHDEGGCAVTGGAVYRGAKARALEGVYLFGDYCSGSIWAGWRDNRGTWQRAELEDTDLAISTFGEDDDGEVYLADKDGGVIYRLGAVANR